MYYLVALGNPGQEYEQTRHNIGWLVLDQLRSEQNFSALVASSKYSGQVAEGEIAHTAIQALYPDTFMNNSGVAVRKLLAGADTSTLIVLHDDVALPLSEIKVSIGRGDGGHNGIKSIIKELGSNEFIRIRIGVAGRAFLTGKTKIYKGGAMARFVLGKFTKKELATISEVATLVNGVVKLIITEGVERAMNQYN